MPNVLTREHDFSLHFHSMNYSIIVLVFQVLFAYQTNFFSPLFFVWSIHVGNCVTSNAHTVILCHSRKVFQEKWFRHIMKLCYMNDLMFCSYTQFHVNVPSTTLFTSTEIIKMRGKQMYLCHKLSP